jgi:hypothetical protein
LKGVTMGIRAKLRELPTVARPAPSMTALHLVSGNGTDSTGHGGLAQVTTTATEAELPDGTTFNRAPKDMRSWEIHATYRLAWHLACFLPSARLAQMLANWLCMAQNELELRGEWLPESLPPQSM